MLNIIHTIDSATAWAYRSDTVSSPMPSYYAVPAISLISSKRMQKMRYLPFLIAAALALTGCGIKREYLKASGQLDTLVAGQRRLEARIDHLDSLARAQGELLERLRAEAGPGPARGWPQPTTASAMVSSATEPKPGLSLPLGTAMPDTAGAKPPKPRAETDPKARYDMAYLEITRGNHDQAAARFREFLKSYPHSSLADNAQYWIGESFYAREKYADALAEFRKVVSDYPNQDKVPAAMYKSGLCHAKLGNPAKAAEEWKQLVAKYPRSNEATLARERLKELGP